MRAERLSAAEARARLKLDTQRQRLAQRQALQRDDEGTQRHQRYLAVGTLLDDAGLLALDDATLAGLFALLGPLAQAPAPVATLEALLGDTARPVRGSG